MRKEVVNIVEVDKTTFSLGNAQLDLALPRGLEAAFGLNLARPPLLVFQPADIALDNADEGIEPLRGLRDIPLRHQLP